MLKFRAALLLSASLTVLLAGCGGGHSGIVPSAIASPVASAKTKASVKFTVSVPKAAQSTQRRPAYVSPATVSMSISVMQGATSVLSENVGLTPTSIGCSSTLASTQCVLTLALLPGAYTASISTFDGANATGNPLSTAQSVAFTVVEGTANSVPLVLSGIPAQILPAYTGNGQFYVAALDADGNYIVGVGAPNFAVTQSSGSSVATITQPTTASPNAFELAQAGSGSEGLSITASYPVSETNGCAQTGAVCATTFSVSSSPTQTLFVANYYTESSIVGFTVPFTSSSPTPAYSIASSNAYAIATDPSGNLFIGAYNTTTPNTEYAPPYSSISASTPTANDSVAVALDSHDNLFVASQNNCIAEYSAASHYTGTIGTTTAGLDGPYSLVFDANNDLFVGNYSNSTVTEYASGSYATAAETITVGSDPYQEIFDTSGDLFVVNYGANTVDEFKPPFSTASTPYAIIPTGSGPYREAINASGDLFVENYTDSTISEFAPPFSTGMSASATFASQLYPYGLAFDTLGNLYAINYYGGSDEEGSITEYSPPFSSSTTPVYTVTAGLDYPSAIAIGPATGGSLVVSL